jgi:alkylation response protein AidB-like acyl-CoA dehydrogenase
MSDTGALNEFRKETHAWLEANCPPSMRTPMVDSERVWAARNITFPNKDARLWFERMVEKGWCVPTYPREYGGGGLSSQEADILGEEMRALHCRVPQYSFGISMVGPVLLEFGTEEQKREFLPKIARGELRWCQGFSEPGAGSDLASLRTAAQDKGDHYIVNGSKIWNSQADRADWVYCLVRTDPEAPKQRGISFLLFDMNQPGISVKKIRLISGDSEFCEIFIDNARAEKAHRIGEENQGWTVAKRLLQHERAMMADLSAASSRSYEAEDVARKTLTHTRNRIADGDMRHRLVKIMMERLAVKLTNRRAELEIQHKIPSATPLVLKYAGTEYEKRSAQYMADVRGLGGVGWEGSGFDSQALDETRRWLAAHAYTIAGGSSEVQLNIIAKRALGLPVA